MFAQANFLLSSVRSSKDESSPWEAAKQHRDPAYMLTCYGYEKHFIYRKHIKMQLI